jgi:hypothetical protein
VEARNALIGFNRFASGQALEPRKGVMLKAALAVASALAVAIFSTAVSPAAMANPPKCKNKANKYVACTDKLKTSAQRQSGGVGDKDVQTLGAVSLAIKRGTLSTPDPRGPKRRSR